MRRSDFGLPPGFPDRPFSNRICRVLSLFSGPPTKKPPADPPPKRSGCGGLVGHSLTEIVTKIQGRTRVSVTTPKAADIPGEALFRPRSQGRFGIHAASEPGLVGDNGGRAGGAA